MKELRPNAFSPEEEISLIGINRRQPLKKSSINDQ